LEEGLVRLNIDNVKQELIIRNIKLNIELWEI
jgi:hypothetical protein